MRTPHNRYPRSLKNSSDYLYFFAKSLTFSVIATADPQMNRIRMYFQNPLDFSSSPLSCRGKCPHPLHFIKADTCNSSSPYSRKRWVRPFNAEKHPAPVQTVSARRQVSITIFFIGAFLHIPTLKTISA